MELAGSSQTQTFPIWLDSTQSYDETLAAFEFDLPNLDDLLSLNLNTNEITNETFTTPSPPPPPPPAAAPALASNNAAAGVSDKYLENTPLDMFDLNGDEFLFGLDNVNFSSTDDTYNVALTADRIDSPSAEITYSNVNTEMTEEFSSTTLMSTATSMQTASAAQFYDDSSSTSMPYSPASSSVYIATRTSGMTTSNDLRRVRNKTIDKKESNKAAAERYRFKKLREKEMLFGECELYAKKNADLKRKICDIQTEISFIKSLLVEALIAKTKASS